MSPSPALLLPVVAPAQEVDQLEAAATVELAVEPQEVWDFASDFHDLAWQPAAHSQAGGSGNEPDATRALVLGQEGGPIIDGAVLAYDAKATRSLPSPLTCSPPPPTPPS
jgi:hypothetical protein